MKTKYQVQTGGKLYLAGEYAVLTPGYGAVIQFYSHLSVSYYPRSNSLPVSLRSLWLSGGFDPK